MRVLEVRLGVGEERDRRDVEPDRALRLAHGFVDAEPVDARHRRDGRALVLALDEEERPDEVVRRQHMLGNEPPRPFGLAVAAGPMGDVEPVGFRDAGRLVHGGGSSFRRRLYTLKRPACHSRRTAGPTGNPESPSASGRRPGFPIDRSAAVGNDMKGLERLPSLLRLSAHKHWMPLGCAIARLCVTSLA